MNMGRSWWWTGQRLSRVRISESQFANDLVLYAVNHAMFESAGEKLFRLEVNLV